MSATTNKLDDIAILFRQQLNVDVADADVDLIEDGLLDSLMLVDLLMYLEQEYQITITFEDLELENFRTIRSIEKFIDAK